MTDVSSSSARCSSKSISDKSALLPRLMNFEKPTFEPIAQSSIAVHNAPDWEKNAIRPFGGIPFANDALRFEFVSISPRQFGPRSLMPRFLAFDRTSFSSLAPSAPVSLKPADIMIAPFIPFLAQSSSTGGINFGGITIIARSIVPSIFSRDGNVLSPRISGALGFTGNILPGKLWVIRFARMLWPVFPSSREAPMTATDLGLKKLSSTQPPYQFTLKNGHLLCCQSLFRAKRGISIWIMSSIPLALTSRIVSASPHNRCAAHLGTDLKSVPSMLPLLAPQRLASHKFLSVNL